MRHASFAKLGEDAAYDWLYDNRGFTTAVRFRLWKLFVERGYPVDDIAKSLKVKPQWVLDRLSDRRRLTIENLSDLTFAMNARVEPTFARRAA